ncbi:MAG: response regulator transcription factor [Acidobacteriota bacterium]
MQILIAEDDSVSRFMVEKVLKTAGHQTQAVIDGHQAWEILEQPGAPRLLVLDWMMPGVDGPEICRRLRAREGAGYSYVILLTAKTHREDVVAGLEAGADDFISKPFERQELLSRVRAGMRILELEDRLELRVKELKDALDHVEQLQGLIPICMMCRKVRDEEDTWQRLETYIQARSAAIFSHALCEDCRANHYRQGVR